MEVSLLEGRNLPKGSILSVRAGTTRRQAPADPDKLKLGFPKGLQVTEPLRIDLLANLGSACVDVTHGLGPYDICFPQENNKYAVVINVKGQVQAADNGQPVEMNPTTPSAGGNAANDIASGLIDAQKGGDKGGASRRHQAAISAREYLDNNKILVWAQTLFHDLIRDEPVDPWSYIEEHLDCGRRAGGGAPLSLRTRVQKITEAAKKVGQDVASQEGAQAGDAERLQIGSKIQDCADTLNKELSKQLDYLEELSVQTLKDQVKNTLTAASASGELSAALKTVLVAAEEPQPDVETVQISMAVNNVDLAALTQNPAMLASFNDKMAEGFLAAAGPGVDKSMITITLIEGSIIVVCTITPPAGVSIEDLSAEMTKQDLQATVVKQAAAVEGIAAVASGPISCEAPTVKKVVVPAPPKPASKVPSKQSAGGPPPPPSKPSHDKHNEGTNEESEHSEHTAAKSAAPPKKPPSKESAAPQESAPPPAQKSAAPAKSAAPPAQDVEELRKLASSTLVAASQDGRLAAALTSTKKPEEEALDVEALRKMASETLVSASQDGRLAKALESGKKARGRSD